MKEALLIVLGWLLGLLAPVIVDAIRRRYTRKEVKQALGSELASVKAKLIGVVYQIQSYSGTCDRKVLQWTLEQCKKSQDALSPKGIEALEKLLTCSDDQLNEIAKIRCGVDYKAIGFKKMELPFLDSHITSLSSFDLGFQKAVLEIKAKVGIINQETEQAKFYFEKSFDTGLSAENRKILQVNISESYDNLSNQARLVIKQIDDITQPNGNG